MDNVTNALAFEHLSEPPGIEVIDRIEQQRYSIYTPEPVSLRESSTEAFRFPIGRAVAFETTGFELSNNFLAFVHDADGGMVAEVDGSDDVSLPEDTYSIELAAPIKTFINFEASVNIAANIGATTVTFDEETTVRLGVRSRHERPAGTVTTTSDPLDIMAAIETFGSALKTIDPERSYPTLRGHPPAIELGERRSIPSKFSPPDTGITLELPLNLETLFVAAPLSYYLGATLEPGSSPRLLTEDGFEYALEGPQGYETVVGNTLKQLFFLDCVTRTEGLYELPLAERAEIEPHVDIDFADLYDRSLTEQVETYLTVPFTIVEDHLPEWPLSTHVAPVPDTIEQLPFVVDDLAVIQTPGTAVATSTPMQGEDLIDGLSDEVITRSAGPDTSGAEESFVQPDVTDAVEQAWIGDDIPIGASKLTTDAFRNRLDREIAEGDIEIAIVVNDDRMDDERDVVDRVYGDRENLPFDVTVHRNTTVEELRELLGRQRGFLHYIGHTEHDGFECTDGKLDAATLDDVGIESFLLNACKSYKQGLSLIEAGAIGGIVTLTDIINEEGIAIGESVARLLNAGFPLQASLRIARDESIQGGQYIVVGDGGMAVAQAESRTPTLIEVYPEGEDFEVQIATYTTDLADLGTIFTPHLSQVENYHLASKTVDPRTVSRSELQEFLQLEEIPIRSDEGLYWSSSVNIDDL